jgi:hypothetical protein
MSINYISLGSFCHPKMFLRNTKREISRSLPFDFHSSPNTYSIYNILNKLYKNKSYIHEFNEILFEHEHNGSNKKELAISDNEGVFFLHFFDTDDKINNNTTYPMKVKDNINNDKIIEIQNKFKKRYEDLYKVLNSKDDILIFLRIENYENKVWNIDLPALVNSIKQFNHPNKFLIYTQPAIDKKLDFNVSKKINYDYGFPIIFHKILFDEKISSDKIYKDKFTNCILNFESIIKNCVLIKYNGYNLDSDITYYYYFDAKNKLLIKLNDINVIYRVDTITNKLLKFNYNNNLFIFLKNKNNVFEKIS